MMLVLLSTPTLIPKQWAQRTKPETANSASTIQCQYHKLLSKQTRANTRALFIPPEHQERTREILFLCRHKTTVFIDAAYWRDLSWREAGPSVAGSPKDAFPQGLHGQPLGGRKDIKAFFPELTEEYREVGWPSTFWPKAAQEVWGCHSTSMQSCFYMTNQLVAKLMNKAGLFGISAKRATTLWWDFKPQCITHWMW